MGNGYNAVNVVDTNSGVNPDESHFEAMYNVEVYFLANQAGGSLPSYPRPGGNQGWNRYHDDGWRDKILNGVTGAQYGDKNSYVPPHKRQKLKEPRADPKSFRIEDMLARILNKVERSDKVLKEIKDDVSSLNQIVTSH
ncbi:hypothetical protein MTR67_031373 [Solanum verrucosum]|uniref:Uncharacterized protein n=1 Tax=Solanum verrucosum TaxID=315347 RepID=A0AAF0U2C3_SOLVR|nr:hypothetical protein MTR67_031373 [Solanum verrucosum]